VPLDQRQGIGVAQDAVDGGKSGDWIAGQRRARTRDGQTA
jgi:hypothetical protein